METESKVSTIFFSKEKLLDIVSKNQNFKKALWKEAAIEIIGLYGIFEEIESGRSHHYHDITIMCHESSVYIAGSNKEEEDETFEIPRGYGIFVLNGTVRINDSVVEKFNFISAEVDDRKANVYLGTVLLVVPPTALSVMRLTNPLMQHQADPLGQVLQSLAYSSKEGKMEILEAVIDSLTLTKLSQLVENDKDFSKTDQDKKFVNDVILKKREAIVDAVANSEHFRDSKIGRTRALSENSGRIKSVG